MSQFKLLAKLDGSNNSISYAGLKTTRFLHDNRKKFFIFNSRYRTNPSASSNNCVIQTPELIQNIKSMTLEYFSIPMTIYNISAATKNNIFAGTQGAPFSVTVPDGNYTPTSLFSQLSTLLLAATGNVWTFTLSSTTALVTIASGVAFTLDFTVVNAMWLELGFLKIITPLSVSVTGTSVIQLQGTTELYINIQNYESVLFSTNIAGNFTVPVNVPFGEIITYQRNVGQEQINFFNMTNNKFATFEIQLLNASGQLVDLNGAEWTLIISVTNYD